MKGAKGYSEDQPHRISHFVCPEAPVGTEEGICAICGFKGNGQYLRNKVLDLTASNVTALFDLRYEHICAPCYGLWSRPKRWHRGFVATPDQVAFPVISIESVTPDRETWSNVLRRVDASTPRAIILTTDPKKRVWPFARVSAGENCSIYLHDPSRGISGNRTVRLPALSAALNLVESIYALGFSKRQIATSLFSHKLDSLDLAEALKMESRLAVIRNTPEFIPALIVSQKEQSESEYTAAFSLSDIRFDATCSR